MKNPALPAAIVMFAASAAILGFGLYAFTSAPPDANKMTAIMIPGAIAGLLDLCGVAALLLGAKSPGLARNAVIIGTLICMLTAGVVGMQGWKRQQSVQRHKDALAEWTRMVTPDEQRGIASRPDNPENKKAYFEGKDAPLADPTYLVNALFGIAGVGGLAFLLLLALKPKAN
jgi:hypothetical protein